MEPTTPDASSSNHWTRWLVRLPALIAVILIAELLASACVRQVRATKAVQQMIEAELAQEPFKNADWAPAYWNELGQYREQWDPYFVYRVADLPGPLVTVTNGVRRTYRSAARIDGQPRLVFVFGGSATWGHGVRDEFTLPSWLARVAEEHGTTWDVRNYAESGWVNWQGIVYLLQKLADGERPDIVIFYSGVNEALNAGYWPTIRRPILNADAYPTAMGEWVLQKDQPLLRTWDYYRKTSLVFSYLTGHHDYALPVPNHSEEIAQLVARDYLADRSLVESLGRAYGFKSVFAWQVTVATKPHLTLQERTYARWLASPTTEPPTLDWWAMPVQLRDFYEKIGRAVTSAGVANLNDAFNGVRSTAFIDWVHPSELGNEHVARSLYRWLVQSP